MHSLPRRGGTPVGYRLGSTPPPAPSTLRRPHYIPYPTAELPEKPLPPLRNEPLEHSLRRTAVARFSEVSPVENSNLDGIGDPTASPSGSSEGIRLSTVTRERAHRQASAAHAGRLERHRIISPTRPPPAHAALPPPESHHSSHIPPAHSAASEVVRSATASPESSAIGGTEVVGGSGRPPTDSTPSSDSDTASSTTHDPDHLREALAALKRAKVELQESEQRVQGGAGLKNPMELRYQLKTVSLVLSETENRLFTLSSKWTNQWKHHRREVQKLMSQLEQEEAAKHTVAAQLRQLLNATQGSLTHLKEEFRSQQAEMERQARENETLRQALERSTGKARYSYTPLRSTPSPIRSPETVLSPHEALAGMMQLKQQLQSLESSCRAAWMQARSPPAGKRPNVTRDVSPPRPPAGTRLPPPLIQPPPPRWGPVDTTRNPSCSSESTVSNPHLIHYPLSSYYYPPPARKVQSPQTPTWLRSPPPFIERD